MRATTVLLSSLLLLASIACSTGSGDASSESGGTTEALAKLTVDKCDYRYICPEGDSRLAKSVSPRDAGSHGREQMGHYYDSGTSCQAGYVTLRKDGSGRYEDYAGDHALHEVQWRMVGADFTLCEGAECIACTMLDVPSLGPSSGEAAGARCTGAADGCYGRAAGSCSSQAGCDGHIHYPVYGSPTFECNGTARACDTLTSSLACSDQSGCSWR